MVRVVVDEGSRASLVHNPAYPASLLERYKPALYGDLRIKTF